RYLVRIVDAPKRSKYYDCTYKITTYPPILQ
ncbi:unnamed protein product, partial [marine sediment metagenome]